MARAWPPLMDERFPHTRAGLHAFAKLLGAYASALAPRRRHWWHISLKPAAGGFRTGVLESNERLFELALSFDPLEIELMIAGERRQSWPLQGESAQSIRQQLDIALARHAIAVKLDESRIATVRHAIDPGCASGLGQVYGQLAQGFVGWRKSLRSKAVRYGSV